MTSTFRAQLERLRRTPRLAARGAEALMSTAAAGLLARAHLGVVRPAHQRAVLEGYKRLWAARMLHAGGAELVLAGPPAPPARGPRLVVANHRSMLDTPVMLRLFGGHFLAHSGLATVPLLGAAARVGGVVFVDRDAPSSRLLALRALKRLLEQGATVIVFPEGTTYAGDEVRPFSAGAFHLAPDVEVLPVGLAYETPEAEYGDETLGAHAARVAGRPRTRVVVAIGEPVEAPPRGPERARLLADRAHAAVQALVYRARGGHTTPR